MKELLNLFMILPEYCIDFLRAIKWSKASPFCPAKNKLYYEIILLAHTVEKGLSITNPRLKFGKLKIEKLLGVLNKYDDEWDTFPVEKSYGCLVEYVELHKNKNIDLGILGDEINKFILTCESRQLSLRGGTKMIFNNDTSSLSYENALNARYSSRRYKHLKVEDDLIERIVNIALRTPSQCNRQTTHIHYFSDKEVINKLLLLQGGAEGFREDVYNLFVISSDMSAWSGYKARSQTYVDASLLSMQVLNACQSLNLVTCPLNLAVSNLKELKICKTGNIPTNERLIMMISFGYSDGKDMLVARSERVTKERLLCVHK